MERPILFSAPMVRAILDGTKTQTRRIVKPQLPSGYGILGDGTQWADPITGKTVRCPYGQSGDRLWVRETWTTRKGLDQVPPREISKSQSVGYIADITDAPWEGRIRPSIHMPRWASRITLEIVDVRVERLQDISEKDALEEGVTYNDIPNNGLDPMRARTWFRGLWETINGAGSWSANPWVWVIEFKDAAQ